MGVSPSRSQGLVQDLDAFLGVEKSVRGFKWVERLKPAQAPIAIAIAQRHGVSEILGRLLAAREVGLDDVADVLNPTLRALLPDPSTFTDMDPAADRIAKAILANEKIAIFGDYDVDGASASALLFRFCQWHGLSPRIYIPDRITEGYGPNPAAINELIDAGHTLIVTVDCGSTSFESLEVAKKRGIDVVVVDHHQVGEDLPHCHALVNPNRQDCLSGYGYLCAAGLTFVLLVALARALRTKGAYAKTKEPNLLNWLDIVALATVCDVVPLQKLNRAFVVQGLKVLHGRTNPGLKALADAAGVLKAPTTYTLGFMLGPRINAGGRIGDAALGARLLSTEDSGEAQKIAQTLDLLNRERREMELKAVEEALAFADKELMDNASCPILIARSKDWHKGLVGLVASRLTDRFQRPSLIFAEDEIKGEVTGSARSIAGVDIGMVVRKAVEAGHAKKGGGHAMAAGVTVNEDRFVDFKAFMVAQLQASYLTAAASPTLAVDGALNPKSLTGEFARQIESAGPFGQSNPAPRFAFAGVRLGFLKEISGGHLRLTLRSACGSDVQAVAFRAETSGIGEALKAFRDRSFHVVGRVEKSDFGGRERIEFHVEDLSAATP